MKWYFLFCLQQFLFAAAEYTGPLSVADNGCYEALSVDVPAVGVQPSGFVRVNRTFAECSSLCLLDTAPHSVDLTTSGAAMMIQRQYDNYTTFEFIIPSTQLLSPQNFYLQRFIQIVRSCSFPDDCFQEVARLLSPTPPSPQPTSPTSAAPVFVGCQVIASSQHTTTTPVTMSLTQRLSAEVSSRPLLFSSHSSSAGDYNSQWDAQRGSPFEPRELRVSGRGAAGRAGGGEAGDDGAVVLSYGTYTPSMMSIPVVSASVGTQSGRRAASADALTGHGGGVSGGGDEGGKGDGYAVGVMLHTAVELDVWGYARATVAAGGADGGVWNATPAASGRGGGGGGGGSDTASDTFDQPSTGQQGHISTVDVTTSLQLQHHRFAPGFIYSFVSAIVVTPADVRVTLRAYTELKQPYFAPRSDPSAPHGCAGGRVGGDGVEAAVRRRTAVRRPQRVSAATPTPAPRPPRVEVPRLGAKLTLPPLPSLPPHSQAAATESPSPPPVVSRVCDVYGMGSYTSHTGTISPTDSHFAQSVSHKVSWDLSGTYEPWQGMYLPPLPQGASWYNDPTGTQPYHKVNGSFIVDNYASFQATGVTALSYWNGFHYGANISFGSKPPSTAASVAAAEAAAGTTFDRFAARITTFTPPPSPPSPPPSPPDPLKLWPNASRFIYDTLNDSIAWGVAGYFYIDAACTGGNGKWCQRPGPTFDWQGSVALDPGASSFIEYVDYQATKHVTLLGDAFSGIVIDENFRESYFSLSDWADDGVSLIPVNCSIPHTRRALDGTPLDDGKGMYCRTQTPTPTPLTPSSRSTSTATTSSASATVPAPRVAVQHQASSLAASSPVDPYPLSSAKAPPTPSIPSDPISTPTNDIIYRPVSSFRLGWLAAVSSIRAAVGNAVILRNTNLGALRADMGFDLDGYFTEPSSADSLMWLALRRPAVLWTMTNEICCTSRRLMEAFFGGHAVRGLFPMAPFPGNDHSVLPTLETRSAYLGFGGVFKALEHREMLLLSNVAEVVAFSNTTSLSENLPTHDGGRKVVGGASHAARLVSPTPHRKVERIHVAADTDATTTAPTSAPDVIAASDPSSIATPAFSDPPPSSFFDINWFAVHQKVVVVVAVRGAYAPFSGTVQLQLNGMGSAIATARALHARAVGSLQFAESVGVDGTYEQWGGVYGAAHVRTHDGSCVKISALAPRHGGLAPVTDSLGFVCYPIADGGHVVNVAVHAGVALLTLEGVAPPPQ